MLTVYIFVTSFVLAGIWGYVYHRARVWSVIDVIYYPLGATGLVLGSVILTATYKQESLINKRDKLWSEIVFLSQLSEPVSRWSADDTAIIMHDFIEIKYWEIFETIPSLADNCRMSSKLTPVCVATIAFSVNLEEYVHHFRAYEIASEDFVGDIFLDDINPYSISESDRRSVSFSDGEEKLSKVLSTTKRMCNAASDLIVGLYKNPSSPIWLIDELAGYYEKGLKNGITSSNEKFPILSWEQKFKVVGKARIEEYFSTRDFGSAFIPITKEDIDVWKATNIAYIELMADFLRMLSPCVGSSTEIRKRQNDYWMLQKKQNNITAIARPGLASVRQSNVSGVLNAAIELIKTQIWVLILAIAASLKFGKAVAALRK